MKLGMVTTPIPPHRVINLQSRSCETCGKFLHDCMCPTGLMCEYCGLDPEDAVYLNPIRCTDVESPDGGHRWRDDQGEEVMYAESDPRLAVNICIRCHVDEPLPGKMVCGECDAERVVA